MPGISTGLTPKAHLSLKFILKVTFWYSHYLIRTFLSNISTNRHY